LLAWAACGKDPGLNPEFILGQAGRSARYTQQDINTLAFAGKTPDAGALGRTWRELLGEAHEMVAVLPEYHVGQCVMHRDRTLFNGATGALKDALTADAVLFHEGTVRGAWPTMKYARTDR
jgi:hypothetical protein